MQSSAQLLETSSVKYDGSVPRIKALDSLRGLAAMTVVLHHILVSFPLFWACYQDQRLVQDQFVRLMAFSPLHLLWGGLEAVVVFFVLSGFVLTLPLTGSRRPSYCSFLGKRACRIYPPYLAAVALGAILLTITPSSKPAGLSNWFAQFWDHSITWVALRDQLLMTGSRECNFVNPVVWSLIHEMRISLVFPALVLWVKQTHWMIVVPSAALFSLAAKLSMRLVVPDSLAASLLETCSYLVLFVAGIELALRLPELKRRYLTLRAFGKIGLGVLSLLLLNGRWYGGGAWQQISVLSIWSGAVLLVGLVSCCPRLSSCLTNTSLNRLGQISYSLYLTHLLVLFAGMYLLRQIVPSFAIMLVVIPTALAMSIGFYLFVERPSARLSKRILQPTKAFEDRAIESSSASLPV